MKCKLIGYRRVSTQKQGQSGLGLEAQDTTINAYVAATGCDLVASYTEVESGDDCHRPELLKALSHARRIGATLVIARIDRLARNHAFTVNLMDAGVDFVCCDMPSANRLTIHIMSAVAEDFRLRLSKNTKDALTAAKARGVKLGGKREGSHLLTKEDRQKAARVSSEKSRATAINCYADLVPLMTELREQGLSFGAIADRLNSDGHTTRTGTAWQATQVMRALKRAN